MEPSRQGIIRREVDLLLVHGMLAQAEEEVARRIEHRVISQLTCKATPERTVPLANQRSRFFLFVPCISLHPPLYHSFTPDSLFPSLLLLHAHFRSPLFPSLRVVVHLDER